MADKSPRVNVSDDRDAVAFEIRLGGFTRAPVGGERGKFADDQPFDIRLPGFLVIEVGANVADVGIREADNLAGIAGIRKYFLIAGKAGIKNDFAATTDASARRTTVKYSSVLERESRACCGGLVQCVLQKMSSRCRAHG
jgi:hypothetical protein